MLVRASELSTSAEQLAKDNVALAAEAVQCRTQAAASARKAAAAEARVEQLQELYLRGLKAAGGQAGGPPAEAEAGLRRELWDKLVTEEVFILQAPASSIPQH